MTLEVRPGPGARPWTSPSVVGWLSTQASGMARYYAAQKTAPGTKVLGEQVADGWYSRGLGHISHVRHIGRRNANGQAPTGKSGQLHHPVRLLLQMRSPARCLERTLSAPSRRSMEGHRSVVSSPCRPSMLLAASLSGCSLFAIAAGFRCSFGVRMTARRLYAAIRALGCNAFRSGRTLFVGCVQLTCE